MPRKPMIKTSRVEVTVPYGWDPRAYQMDAWAAIEENVRRMVLLWHRRAGKDSVCLNGCITKMLKRRGLYWHVFPTYQQGRKIMWNGMTKDGKRFMHYFPGFADIKGTGSLVKRKLEDEMLIELKNGSIYQIVGTDKIDNLVGSNPVGVIMSEFSLQNPAAWDLLRPILAENEGWAWFPYTPRGRNHGHDLFRFAEKQMREGAGWFAQMLTVDDTHAVSEAAIQEDREAGMPEELVKQEYWCSFDAPLVGAYYSENITLAQEQQRLTRLPWMSQFPVNTAWDIGVTDATAIWFYQNIGEYINLIDYYEGTGKGIEHYAKKLESLPYAYGEHWGPHDLMKTEFGTGKKIIEIAQTLNLRFRVAPKLTLEEGITAARALFPRCRFDEVQCNRGIEALKQYRKEWDDERKCFADNPLRDWTTHGADAFRYLAVGLRGRLAKPRQVLAQSEFDSYKPPAQEFARDDYDEIG